MTGHFHRQVLAAPDKFRAAKAVSLGSKLIAQLASIRQSLRGDSVAVVTAHLRSPVGDAFRETEARKLIDLIKKGFTSRRSGTSRNMSRTIPSSGWAAKASGCTRR